jgi:uridine phosphorylase
MTAEFPILEFDPSPTAIVEPHPPRQPKDFPEHAVACFFQHVFTHLIEAHHAQQVWQLRSEMGTHPVYEVVIEGQRLLVFHPGVGAPLAAGFLEEVIALGCTKIIACGGAGVLESSIALGHSLVVTSAVRDEGTSYHYLPPSREVVAAPAVVAVIEGVLQRHASPYLLVKTWTTDALYRETRGKIQQRRAEGCLAVEMEAAAFLAVAQFRGITFGQLLYGGDDVSGEQHDWRAWDEQMAVREQLFWFAAEACLQL